MGTIIANVPVKSSELHAVVIRKDGTREDYGCIAYYHRNPLKRAWWRLRSLVRRGPRVTGGQR